MIQWERDFMCEDDSSVIVRCDRPDDFNKTISWNFRTLSLSSTIERSTHPGMNFSFKNSKAELEIFIAIVIDLKDLITSMKFFRIFIACFVETAFVQG